MAPKRAAAAAAAVQPATATKTTKKTKTAAAATATATAVTKKTSAVKADAPKKAVAAKKTAAPAKKPAAPKKTAAAATKKTAAAPKKAAAAAPKKKTVKPKAAEESDKENEANAPKVNGAKRKRDDEDEKAEGGVAGDAQVNGERGTKRAKKEEAPAAPVKKRKIAAPKAPKPKRVPRELKAINEAPTQVMDIFVFGEGTAGELGLGSVRVDGKKPIDVKRPRLNPNLKGIVQVACGGMHVAALTQDNKILTWGVNDQGALGRDTTWDGGLRDVSENDKEESDDDESDDDDDTGMNPKESTPAEVDTSNIPENTTWVQLVASDSATFALTTTGQVYGWGTFRVSLRHPPPSHSARKI